VRLSLQPQDGGVPLSPTARLRMLLSICDLPLKAREAEGAARVIRILVILVSVFCFAATSFAQSSNLATCLSGKFPVLCDKQALTPDQRRQAEAAEQRENLKQCLMGKFPVLCNHTILTRDEAERVRAAEARENLATCLTGKFPVLCNKHLLSAEERRRVEGAERRENLAICLTGRYAALCQRQFLTADEAKRVEEAERQVAQSRQAMPRTATTRGRPLGGRGASGCDSGHWVQSVANDGQIVILEDSSVWEIDLVDRVDTMLWLPTTEIVACEDKLINTDDSETAGAVRLR
jgi:hypothetical protein